MKKSRKLILLRETVRRLNDPDLWKVAGGTWADTGCQCTPGATEPCPSATCFPAASGNFTCACESC